MDSKNLFCYCISLVTLISPASVLATPVGQQGEFKVSVAGTATGSIPHEIPLKMTQIPGGQLSETTGFVINSQNVVQVKQGENILVTTSENQKAKNLKAKNVQGQQVDLLPLPNNIWSLQNLVPGVYLLDVIADMSSSGILGVYETVLVILQPDQAPLPPTTVINQLTILIETEFRFEENDTKTPSPSPSPSPCYFDPTLKECQPIDGKCPPGFGFNENDQCVPTGKCPDGYGRLDDDETGKCYKNSEIKTCPDGYITHKNRECPKLVTPQPDPCECPSGVPCPATACPEPVPCPLNIEGIEICPPTDEPIVCPEGFELVGSNCEPICDLDPTDPGCLFATPVPSPSQSPSPALAPSPGPPIEDIPEVPDEGDSGNGDSGNGDSGTGDDSQPGPEPEPDPPEDNEGSDTDTDTA